MVGIENRNNENNHGNFDEETFSQLVENLLSSLNNLRTNDTLDSNTSHSHSVSGIGHEDVESELPIRDFNPQNFNSFYNYDSNNNSDLELETTETNMTILPKKKSHKDRSGRHDRDRQDAARRGNNSRHESHHSYPHYNYSNQPLSISHSLPPANIAPGRSLYAHSIDHQAERHVVDSADHVNQVHDSFLDFGHASNMYQHHLGPPTTNSNGSTSVSYASSNSGISRQSAYSHNPSGQEDHERVEDIVAPVHPNPSTSENSFRHPLSERTLLSYHQSRNHDSHHSSHFSHQHVNSNNKRGLCVSNNFSNNNRIKMARKVPSNDFYGSSDGSDENNSEDEYYGTKTQKTVEDEKNFEKMIEKKGWCIKKMATDGACLFRAIADQIYGDQEMHDEIRKNVTDYMSKNADHFSQYVTEDFSKYITRKKDPQCYGNHLEIQAIAEMYNRPVQIYYYDLEPCNVFQGDYKTDNPPIRLSYHGNVHYNSIREPFSATVGVGLGLPGFQPGLAEKQLLTDAMKASEDCAIEEAMLKDKMMDSFWDRAEAQIEEQVAQESYLDWLGTAKQELPRKKLHTGGSSSPKSHLPKAVGASCTSCSSSSSPKGAQARMSPNRQTLGIELADHMPIDMAGWDEDAILAHVLAESTLDYYETLRKSQQPGCSKDS